MVSAFPFATFVSAERNRNRLCVVSVVPVAMCANAQVEETVLIAESQSLPIGEARSWKTCRSTQVNRNPHSNIPTLHSNA